MNLEALMATIADRTAAWGLDDNRKEGLGCSVWWRPHANGPRRSATGDTPAAAILHALSTMTPFQSWLDMCDKMDSKDDPKDSR